MLILAGSALLLIGWLVGQPMLAQRQRDSLRKRPFPSAWRRVLWRRIPAYRKLPADLQLRLKRQIQVFLAETPFIGCAGLVVTDEMRVTVAAQACLLVLHRGGETYPNLRQILLYPGAFFVDRPHSGAAGVLQESRRLLAGESWSRGQVILSWQDTLEGAADPDDGRNVVLHEFAHQLDQETGPANGAPWLPPTARTRWAKVLGAEFEMLRQRVGQGLPSLLADYGASDPAEFFAVATEVFFEQPQAMAAEHPALYAEFSTFYRVDPRSW